MKIEDSRKRKPSHEEGSRTEKRESEVIYLTTNKFLKLI